MFQSFLICLTLLVNTCSTLSTVTTTTMAITTFDSSTSRLIKNNSMATINNFMVFSSTMETVISFVPEQGWLLNDDNQFRVFIIGEHLENSSIVFTTTMDQCSSSVNDFVSDIYSLSSSPIIEISVTLKPLTKTHSVVYLCLLYSNSNSSSTTNLTQTFRGHHLDGIHFHLIRERSQIPFAAKICLILTLFIVSGFFRYLFIGRSKIGTDT